MCAPGAQNADPLDDLWVLCYPCGWPVEAIEHSKRKDGSVLLYLSQADAIAAALIQNECFNRGCRPCRLKSVAASIVASAKLSRGLPVLNTEG